MRAPDPAATRQRLLDAAWRVLRRHGSQALSLDAVAREAEVSKGGLLHHFPTRAALTTLSTTGGTTSSRPR